MSDIDKQYLNSKAVPFFARYLEGQHCEELSEEQAETLTGGCGCLQTKKFPSDQEDTPGGHPIQTKKFPSDQEDTPGGHPIQTKKFPSDQEDTPGPIRTLKFPSDQEG